MDQLYPPTRERVRVRNDCHDLFAQNPSVLRLVQDVGSGLPIRRAASLAIRLISKPTRPLVLSSALLRLRAVRRLRNRRDRRPRHPRRRHLAQFNRWWCRRPLLLLQLLSPRPPLFPSRQAVVMRTNRNKYSMARLASSNDKYDFAKDLLLQTTLSHFAVSAPHSLWRRLRQRTPANEARARGQRGLARNATLTNVREKIQSSVRRDRFYAPV